MDLPQFRKLGELLPEEAAERQLLVAFCTHLARAILQNSYYSPDHPVARRVAEEPFALLQKLGRTMEELTLIVTSWQESEAMALDGVFQEPVALEMLIGGTAGEHFANKLKTFANRNRLVSFSIKNTIREDEFHRFISVFVERHVDTDSLLQIDDDYETQKRQQARFTEQLIEHNVVNVTIVLEEDLVEDRRRLPWRVKVAISRLRKDLRHLPMFSKATDGELRHAKMRLIQDILRPLAKGLFLKQLFLNLDLISEEVSEFHGLDLEPDLLDALPLSRHALLAEALLTELDRRARPVLAEAPVDARPDLDETIRRLLELIGQRLAAAASDAIPVELLRTLFDHKAVPLSALPKAMQEQIRMDRWTAAFLRDPAGFLGLFDRIESPDAYLQHLPHVVAIFPNLLRAKRYEDGNLILEMLHRHKVDGAGFAGRRDLVTRALAHLDNEEVLRLLVLAMETEPRAAREAVGRLFAEMGTASIPPLLQILEQADREDVCSDAALTLVSLRAPGAAAIAKLLDGRHVTHRTAVYLLKVLGEIGDPAVSKAVYPYTRHPKPAVRAEALVALFRLHGERVVPVLVAATQDEDPDVACRAIRTLDRLPWTEPEYIALLLDLIGPDEDDAPARPEAVQVCAIEALGRMGDHEVGGATLEGLLVDAFGRFDQGRFTAFLQRGKEMPHDRIRIALCDALVAIGGARSKERLQNLSTESSPVVRDRMRRAAAELEARLAETEGDLHG